MAFIGLIGSLCSGQFTRSLARSEVDGFEDLLEPLGKSPGHQIHLGKHVEKPPFSGLNP